MDAARVDVQAVSADHAWPHLHVEAAVLAAADAELVVAQRGDPDELGGLARAPGRRARHGNARGADLDVGRTQRLVVPLLGHGPGQLGEVGARVPAAVLDAAPRCRTVARYGVGLDNIDVEHKTPDDFCSTETCRTLSSV